MLFLFFMAAKMSTLWSKAKKHTTILRSEQTAFSHYFYGLRDWRAEIPAMD